MPPALPDAKKTILLVEDEALIAMLECIDIENGGFNVIHAISGEDAVSIFRERMESIDLVLMDIDLGSGMDGTEAARLILDMCDIPLIFLSSHVEQEVVARTEEITSYGYVVKNTGIPVLFASIRMAFRLFEANRKISMQNLEVTEASARLMEVNSKLLESRSLIIERERHLKRSEELYRAIVENTHDSVYIYQDNRLLYVNRLFCEISGYRPEEIIGRSIASLIHESDRERITAYVERRANGGTVPRSYDARIVMKDGSSRIFEFIPVDIELDGRYAVLGAAIDITDRREAEKEKELALAALRESEEKYKGIFESFVDVYYRVDADGIITELSPSISGVGGWMPSDLVGTPAVNLYDDPAARGRFIESLGCEGVINGFEISLKSKSGIMVPVSIHARRKFDAHGRPAGVEGSIRDISEKKKIEDRLKETLEMYKVLVENSVDMIWTLDYQGVLTYVSPAWEKVLGYGTESVMGRHFSVFIHPDDVEICRNQIFEGIQSGERTTSSPYRVLNSDGTYRWHEANGIAVFNDDGSFNSCVGVSREVHDRKIAEDQLYAAKEAADSANRAKSEFLANMSHEIRTPLNGVIGFTELLCTTELQPQQRGYAEKAMVSAGALLDLVNDILDFSRIEAGKLELEEISTDIRELLAMTTDIVRCQAESKNIGFKLVVAENMPRFVVLDPVRVRQALLNITGNAVKFTESGEVEVKAEFFPAGNSRGVFRFSVRDTGIGITSEQREKIFVAFTQGDASTTRKFGGSGLGLVITKRLLDRMGSTLRLESAPGEGSIFFFDLMKEYIDGSLPVEQDEAPRPAVTDDYDTVIPGYCRILVAEDNEISLELEKAVVKRIMPGAEVFEARNGAEAVKLYLESSPDLVLVDVQMPVMDGYRVASEIRAIEKVSGRHVPVVALTAGAVRGEREKCLRAGMDDYISKPVDYRSFSKLLGRCFCGQAGVDPAADIITEKNAARFDIDALRRRIGGDDDLLENIIDVTLRYFGGYIDELNNAVVKKNYAGTRRLLHLIKGAALNACFNRLASFVKEFEELKPHEHERMSALAAAIKEEYVFVRRELIAAGKKMPR